MSLGIRNRQARLGVLLAAGVAVSALVGADVAAQPAGPQRGQAVPASHEGFQRLRIDPGVYVVQGPDGNVVVEFGPDGALVIDGQSAANTEALLAEIKAIIGDQPIRFFFNTNADAEKNGSNQAIREAGHQVFGGNMAAQAGDLADEAVQMAHENVLLRMSGAFDGNTPAPDGEWPKETYATDTYDFYFNNQGVQLFHAPNAHTDGDTFIYLRRHDVIAAGDLWDTRTYPQIDTAAGGTINGLLAGLNHIIDIAVPSHKQEGGTMIVPGYGRVGDESDVVEYRDMVTIIRDRIKAMADRGMSLEQVKAARPTFDYDGRYGATSGPWTTDMFITAVYEGVRPQRRGR